jgi:hypothetical protein
MKTWLPRLGSRRDVPEAAIYWPVERWEKWLQRACHSYFHSGANDTRRRAFSPFTVEPVSDVDPASQLLSGIRRFAPDALESMAHAVDSVLARWRADDGVKIANFLLRLCGALGAFGEKDARADALLSFATKLSPPLTQEQRWLLADEIAEAAIGRVPPQTLRELAGAFIRHSSTESDYPWRAQLRLFEGLLDHGGGKDLFRDLELTLPNIAAVVRYEGGKRRLADIIVNKLKLPGVVHLKSNPPEDKFGIWAHAYLLFCIFPARVEINNDTAVDNLLKDYWAIPGTTVDSMSAKTEVFLICE